jgi:hypothetical protein
MAFQEIFRATDVAACVQPGIQSLGKYSRLIETDETEKYEGSVDIDVCLAHQYPHDHRWDYAFGYKNRIHYVEIHHVSDSEVRVVISKYRWLKDWQTRQPNTAALKAKSSYHWVSSGKGSLTKNSRYARSLIQAGLNYPTKTLRVE